MLKDIVIFKLKSGSGFNSVWELKSNWPDGLLVDAKELGNRYGEGEFIIMSEPQRSRVVKTEEYAMIASEV